jgi:peptide/nickel transport system substrate-binding protein
MNMKKRIFAIVFCVSSVMSLFTGCGAKNESSADNTAAVLYHAYISSPYITLDPSSEYSNGIMVLQNVYETLTRYNDQTKAVEPMLATEWNSNDEGTEWVFTLRDDVTFHDGTKMTAANVVNSIDRTIEKAEGAAYIWDSVDTVEATGDYEVIFRLSYAAPIDLISSAGYAAYIMSEAVISQDTEWFNQGNDGGTGPYSIAQATGDTVVLKAYDGYRGGWNDDQYKNVIIKETAESSARRQLLESGEAQIASDLSVTDLNALKTETDKVAIYKANTFTNNMVYMNTQADYMNNVDFRRALAYAFPYTETTESVLEGDGVQSFGLIPSGLWGHDESLPQYETDLDKAEEYLDQSGIDPSQVSLELTYTTGMDSDANFSQLFQVNLRKIGVDLRLQAMEWDSQWDKAKNQDPNSRQDMLVMRWWPDYASPASWFDSVVHSEEEISFGLSYINNPDIDSKIEEATELTVTDRDKAQQIYVDIQKQLIDESCFLFLYDQGRTYVLSPKVSGVRENPAYATAILYYDVTHN